MPITKKTDKTRRLLFAISIVITIVIFSCGLIYFFYSRDYIIEEEYSTLESIGNWKLHQIVDWRQERKINSKLIVSNDFLWNVELYIYNQNKYSKDKILAQFDNIQEAGETHYCSLLDTNFEVLISTYNPSEPLSVATSDALITSQSSYDPIISDFFICSEDDIHIDVVSAIRNSSDEIVAYLILRMNAEDYLYPLVQSWPLESETAENLLFKVDGSDILFLNELRHADDTALQYRIPLTNKNLPAVQVAEGKVDIIIGNDYRDIKTIVYGHTVPDTDWYILSKMDYSEVFRGLRLQLVYISLIIALLLVIAPFLVMYLLSRREYSASQRLYQAEIEKNKQNAFFKLVINSIPQRIFWKDKDLKYLGCNTQFAKDRGYESESDIIGRNDYDFHDKDQADIFRERDKELLTSLKSKTGYDEKGVLLGKDVWLRKSKMPIFDEDNNVIGILGTTEDITEQKETQEELNLHASFLQTVYENVNVLLFAFDLSGIITFIEGKLSKQLGLKNEEFIGRSFKDVLYSKDIVDAIEQSLNGETITIGDVMYNGIILNLFFQPAFDDNKVVAVYGIAIDITDINKAIQNLERSNKELEQFAYIASHDLQEPLRMVSNFTQLLEQKYSDVLDDRANKYIFYAVDGAKRMQTLINDLLNYSRINTRERAHKPVDMSDVLEHVKHSMTASILESNAIINSITLPTIVAEPTQMYQLMQNLISNAIKFRSKKKPTIDISYKQIPGFWQFEIKDNGIGIEYKYKDKIFLIFQRLHSKSDYAGTGIGLALCKRIILKHGGRIWFDSNINKGTTFYFTIAKKGE